MYRFPPPPPDSIPTDVYEEIRWGFRVEGDHPLLNDEGELHTDAIKMWWNVDDEIIVELIKR